MLNSFRSAKKPDTGMSLEKETLESFCEEDIQENVKGNGANLSNYSVPFVNFSGIFGKKSAVGTDDEERKDGALSARSDRMTVAQTSQLSRFSKGPSSNSQSMATGIGDVGEASLVHPQVLKRNEREKKDLEKRLAYMESVMKELALQNEQSRKEKSNMQGEMDRIVSELKETKIAWACSEEAQAESEMQLKNKINTLVKEVVKSTGKAPDLGGYQRGATQLRRAKSPKL